MVPQSEVRLYAYKLHVAEMMPLNEASCCASTPDQGFLRRRWLSGLPTPALPWREGPRVAHRVLTAPTLPGMHSGKVAIRAEAIGRGL